MITANPHLENYFKKMIKQGIQEEQRKSVSSPKGTVEVLPGTSGEPMQAEKTPRKETVTPKKNGKTGEMIKSPSDTTIYAPALNKVNKNPQGNIEIIDKISNFVEGIRLETHFSHQPGSKSHEREKSRERASSNSEEDEGDPEPTAQQLADETVLQAEKYQVVIEPPVRGKPMVDMIPQREDKFNDDSYFHLACHVDNTLKNRIQRGEFIDLECLLPKQ